MLPGEAPLVAVGIKPIELGSSDNRIRLVQHQGGRFQVPEKAVGVGVDHVLLRIVVVKGVSAVEVVVGWKQMVWSCVTVRVDIINERIPRIAEINALKYRERVRQIPVLQLEQLAIHFLRE